MNVIKVLTADQARTADAYGEQPGDANESALETLSRLLTGVMMGAGCLFMASALLIFVWVPIAYDTIHLQDTLFFAELGWRVLQGLTPTLDFGHFYGGVVAQYVAWAFQLFGMSVKSIDYAFLLMLGTTVAFASLISLRRLRLTSFVALLVILFACVLARVPFEELTAIQRPTSAHSFIYNRFAASLAVVLFVFVLNPSRSSVVDALAAVACGVATYLIVLTKPTFLPIAPAFLLALSVQLRWANLALAVAGMTIAILVLDPWGARVTGAFDFALASTASHTSVSDLLLKTVAVFLVNPLSLLMAFLALLITLHGRANRSFGHVTAALIMMVGCAGMTATMGWRGSVGQQALPFLSVLCLGLYEWNSRHRATDRDANNLLKIIAICVVMAFSLPHLAQSTLSGIVAMKRVPLLLISDGPLSDYLAWSDEFSGPDEKPIHSPISLDQQAVLARSHIAAGKPVNVGVEYVMVADGMRLLRNVSGLQGRNLAGDYGVFNFAMQTKSVAAFPVWVNKTAPVFASGQSLPPDIDLMMIRRLNKTELSERILEQMAGHFTICMVSDFWELYAREGSDQSFCKKVKADQ